MSEAMATILLGHFSRAPRHGIRRFQLPRRPAGPGELVRDHVGFANLRHRLDEIAKHCASNFDRVTVLEVSHQDLGTIDPHAVRASEIPRAKPITLQLKGYVLARHRLVGHRKIDTGPTPVLILMVTALVAVCVHTAGRTWRLFEV